MIHNLVKRCLKELKDPTLPHAKDLFVIEIWNIFKTMAESQHFIPMHAPTLDIELRPLLSIVESGQKVCFDDDIMEVMCSILTVCKDLTPNLLKMVEVFPCLFEKYGNKVSFLLKIYNLLMIHKSHIFTD